MDGNELMKEKLRAVKLRVLMVNIAWVVAVAIVWVATYGIIDELITTKTMGGEGIGFMVCCAFVTTALSGWAWYEVNSEIPN